MNARRLHPLPLAAGIAVALLTLQLGNWQVRRAAEKTEMQLRLEAASGAAQQSSPAPGDVAEWQAIELAGQWQAGATIYLDNRVHRGRVGYQVLTPLRLADGPAAVLVNRGWIAAGPDRRVLPEVVTPAGPIRVAGTVRRPETEPFTLAVDAAQGQVWQFIDLERFRAGSGIAVADWIVLQTSDADDRLAREWPRPDAGVDRHRGYALQWYSLAGLSLVLTGVYVYRRLVT